MTAGWRQECCCMLVHTFVYSRKAFGCLTKVLPVRMARLTQQLPGLSESVDGESRHFCGPLASLPRLLLPLL